MGTGSLRYQGYEIRYDEHGEGERPIVLIHGLLLNRHLFDRLAPMLAGEGNRVICIDLLGHGDSGRSKDLRLYSTPLFARQVVAVLNHLELETAVIGGTSLGANVSLEVAVRNPGRVEGLVLQMPVLDKAVAAIAALYTPMLLGLRAGRPILGPAAKLASRIPRSHVLIDSWLDFLRLPPGPSADVLEGMMLGEAAPHRDERREIFQPALVVGHQRDPVHPFSDSGMLAGELPEARLVEAGSPLDWKFRPKRLAVEMSRFLDEVWAETEALEGAGAGSYGNGDYRRVSVGR